jgi:hypothetical protein
LRPAGLGLNRGIELAFWVHKKAKHAQRTL